MNQSIPDRWVVISLAGFATAALEPYGSSWNVTPGFNRLAAGSIVWDRAIVPSDDDTAVLQACWQAASQPTHANPSDSPRCVSWLRACGQQGRTELIVANDQQLPPLAEQAGFDRCTVVDVPLDGQTAVESIEETSLAQLAAVLLDRLEPTSADGGVSGDATSNAAADKPWSLLWLHSDSLARFWDAPRWLFPDDTDDESPGRSEEEEFAIDDGDDDDELGQLDADAPPHSMPQTQPPGYRITADDHPDWVMTWMQTYGCQVRLVDELLTVVTNRLQSLPGGPVGLLVLGTSGLSLGQNGWIGHRTGPLRSPQIQVPVFLQIGDQRPLRVPAVTALPELFTTIPLGVPLASVATWACRDSQPVTTQSPRAAKAITNGQWFYVQPAADAAGSVLAGPALYLKPDDRDDVNDVSSRCQAEVAQFDAEPSIELQ